MYANDKRAIGLDSARYHIVLLDALDIFLRLIVQKIEEGGYADVSDAFLSPSCFICPGGHIGCVNFL